MSEPQGNSPRAWTWRHAFASSTLPATTKAVLHTIGMFMNDVGEGCYPSVAQITAYSGLDKKTVLKHIGMARDAGWLAVSQHGFRGQRWKRQEYAARWPERDLVAACAPDENDQGGGAVPPPLNDEKVVELVPEGGGTEGSKVVEQLHQDKNVPDNIPNNIPISREAHAQGSGKENKKALENSFWKIVRDWPQTEGMPKAGWFEAWTALTDDERLEAAAMRDNWIAHLKGMGRSHVPVPRTYFQEKLWKEVPVVEVGAKDPAAERLEAKPCGKLFMARFYGYLFDGATVEVSLNKFERQLVETGRYTAEQMLMKKQADQGFPDVNELISRAEGRRGALVSSLLQPLAEHMVSIEVGSAVWNEWAAEHEKRGWPWFNNNGFLKYVYLPQGGVAMLNELQDLWREVKNDSFK